MQKLGFHADITTSTVSNLFHAPTIPDLALCPGWTTGASGPSGRAAARQTYAAALILALIIEHIFLPVHTLNVYGHKYWALILEHTVLPVHTQNVHIFLAEILGFVAYILITHIIFHL